MPNCKMCGLPVPEGQRDLCSMCYGDIGYGRDGYYEDWARNQPDGQEQEQPQPQEE